MSNDCNLVLEILRIYIIIVCRIELFMYYNFNILKETFLCVFKGKNKFKLPIYKPKNLEFKNYLEVNWSLICQVNFVRHFCNGLMLIKF